VQYKYKYVLEIRSLYYYMGKDEKVVCVSYLVRLGLIAPIYLNSDGFDLFLTSGCEE
jgi:hypothetical protein